MATLEEEMRARGANDMMVNSKTFKMAEEIIAEGAVDGISTAAAIAQRVEDAAISEKKAMMDVAFWVAKAEETVRDIKTVTEALSEQAEKVTITDKKSLEAVNVYTLVLQRTKEIIGPDMTEAVWEKGIEAASYCAWRSIMGPKGPEYIPEPQRSRKKVL